MRSKREPKVNAGQRVGLQVRPSDLDDSPRRLSSVLLHQTGAWAPRMDLPAEGDQKKHTEGGVLKGQ
jgi:hypothetical protein